MPPMLNMYVYAMYVKTFPINSFRKGLFFHLVVFQCFLVNHHAFHNIFTVYAWKEQIHKLKMARRQRESERERLVNAGDSLTAEA